MCARGCLCTRVSVHACARVSVCARGCVHTRVSVLACARVSVWYVLE